LNHDRLLAADTTGTGSSIDLKKLENDTAESGQANRWRAALG